MKEIPQTKQDRLNVIEVMKAIEIRLQQDKKLFKAFQETLFECCVGMLYQEEKDKIILIDKYAQSLCDHFPKWIWKGYATQCKNQFIYHLRENINDVFTEELIIKWSFSPSCGRMYDKIAFNIEKNIADSMTETKHRILVNFNSGYKLWKREIALEKARRNWDDGIVKARFELVIFFAIAYCLYDWLVNNNNYASVYLLVLLPTLVFLDKSLYKNNFKEVNLTLLDKMLTRIFDIDTCIQDLETQLNKKPVRRMEKPTSEKETTAVLAAKPAPAPIWNDNASESNVAQRGFSQITNVAERIKRKAPFSTLFFRQQHTVSNTNVSNPPWILVNKVSIQIPANMIRKLDKTRPSVPLKVGKYFIYYDDTETPREYERLFHKIADDAIFEPGAAIGKNCVHYMDGIWVLKASEIDSRIVGVEIATRGEQTLIYFRPCFDHKTLSREMENPGKFEQRILDRLPNILVSTIGELPTDNSSDFVPQPI